MSTIVNVSTDRTIAEALLTVATASTDATKFLSGAGTYLALDSLHVAQNVTALTPGTTVAWDAAVTVAATLTPGQDETINVSNVTAGRLYALAITTSGTTSRTLTFGTNFV